MISIPSYGCLLCCERRLGFDGDVRMLSFLRPRAMWNSENWG
uniref:Uncharacterized protein n=1 Tax=Arundo donax TaxID=35708 RepID=A0A0A9CIM3_ARUDO